MVAKASVSLRTSVDPVLATVDAAPVGPPETEEERQMVAMAKADGRFVSHAEIQSRIEERARHET